MNARSNDACQSRRNAGRLNRMYLARVLMDGGVEACGKAPSELILLPANFFIGAVHLPSSERSGSAMVVSSSVITHYQSDPENCVTFR